MKVYVITSIMLLFLGTMANAAENCKQPLVNLQGVAGADIVVSASPVVVMDNNPGRCFAIIKNNSANQVRCMLSLQGVPSATAGVLLSQNDWIKLDTDSGSAWRCIRVTNDGAVQVLESIP